jgi:hypothetical protein
MADWYNKTERMLEKIYADTSEIASKLKIGKDQDPKNIIYDNQEFIKLMNISKRTAQQWRDKNIVGFFQVGNKIYYSQEDVQKLLNANYNPKIDKEL